MGKVYNRSDWIDPTTGKLSLLPAATKATEEVAQLSQPELSEVFLDLNGGHISALLGTTAVTLTGYHGSNTPAIIGNFCGMAHLYTTELNARDRNRTCPERAENKGNSHDFSPNGLSLALPRPLDPDLMALVSGWDTLPVDLKACIVAMIRAALPAK